jgi:gpW
MTPSYPARALPLDIKMALKNLTPAQAQTMLAQAQQTYFNLLTGQLPAAVDTPQLGRVTFCATNPADLQRLIDYLNGVVASGSSSSSGNVRKPFSFYGRP